MQMGIFLTNKNLKIMLIKFLEKLLLFVVIMFSPTLVIGLMIWFLNPDLSFRLACKAFWNVFPELIGVLHFFIAAGLVAYLTNPDNNF